LNDGVGFNDYATGEECAILAGFASPGSKAAQKQGKFRLITPFSHS